MCEVSVAETHLYTGASRYATQHKTQSSNAGDKEQR